MPDQESFLQLKSEIQTLKIKDEYRSKELDALMSKLDDTSTKLNTLSDNISRLLAGQETHKTNDNEVRDELKILHTRIGDLHDKCSEMIDKTETRVSSDISLLYKKVDSLERWRWITIGVATAIAWLLTNIIPKFLNN
jgi:predicted  nucleic acid-binding Zn-ribbon protein|tara:strand:- start:166 stop:579 length:414 start_codon:yes stop_codon:yes gene_type:complete